MQALPFSILDGWHVLVVDDEEDSLDVVRILLEAYGATVHTASNGKDGLTLARALKPAPSFIISDLSMPQVDGWQFIETVQKDAALREIPVIALTAHAMTGDRERAIGAGFQNYLTKPLTPETFIQQLVTLLLDIPLLSVQLQY